MIGVVSHFPTRSAYAIAASMGRRRFRRARPALTDAIADASPALRMSADRMADVARGNFEHAACDQLDYALFERLTFDRLPSVLDIRGLDHLRGALERGCGAILYSGHVRGHYLLFAALGLHGFRPHIVGMPIDRQARPAAVAVYERNEQLLRDRFGCRFLFMADADFGVAVRAANALRGNAVVTMEIDHTHSARNVEATFLDRPARFPVGPLLLARASGAPMLPFWLYREKPRARHVALIGEPTDVGEDLDEALRTCLRPLEEQIRAHPESWSTWLFPERRLWVGA
jgi:lauroyl/myristoyl acyltransferase